MAENFDQPGNIDARFAGVDQLYELRPYYRIAGDPQETRFPAPDAIAAIGQQLLLTWTNVNGRGFDAEFYLLVNDCAENASCYGFDRFGSFYSVQLYVTNPGAAPLDIDLFLYQDVDSSGTSSGDSARWIESPFGNHGGPVPGINIADAAGTRNHHVDVYSNGFQVAPFSSLRALLDDGAVTDLDGSGLPFAAGDITLAQQVGGIILGNGTLSLLVDNDINYAVFFDGFESGDFAAWSASSP